MERPKIKIYRASLAQAFFAGTWDISLSLFLFCLLSWTPQKRLLEVLETLYAKFYQEPYLLSWNFWLPIPFILFLFSFSLIFWAATPGQLLVGLGYYHKAKGRGPFQSFTEACFRPMVQMFLSPTTLWRYLFPNGYAQRWPFLNSYLVSYIPTNGSFHKFSMLFFIPYFIQNLFLCFLPFWILHNASFQKEGLQWGDKPKISPVLKVEAFLEDLQLSLKKYENEQDIMKFLTPESRIWMNLSPHLKKLLLEDLPHPENWEIPNTCSFSHCLVFYEEKLQKHPLILRFMAQKGWGIDLWQTLNFIDRKS